jgi:hypothetical protein
VGFDFLGQPPQRIYSHKTMLHARRLFTLHCIPYPALHTLVPVHEKKDCHDGTCQAP